MFHLIPTLLLLSTLRQFTQTRSDLLLEILAQRQQIEILRRRNPRPKLRRTDRLFWIGLCRHWEGWRSTLLIVQPETVLRRHRGRLPPLLAMGLQEEAWPTAGLTGGHRGHPPHLC